ncbi:DNA polymerase I [Lyngbya aestuarii]|uniref:DNA polymerase I n=1 Tax=Lyngbya aestuarii TaxID=118322 RepID=UPI00403DD949
MSQSNSAPNPSSDSSQPTRPLLILVDGHSLAFRSYYAFAKGRDGGLRTKTGTPTSVCFGFLKSLLTVMEFEQPQSMAVAFDLGVPTFRHKADDTYKADRVETPQDFIPDLENLKELLGALRVPVATSPGYEADDILATLAHQASETGYQVKILTGDRDLFQLVEPQKAISVLYLSTESFKRGSSAGPREFNSQEVKEKLGITPAQVVDYKALCGDKSDNIPGVKGIGDKTAVKLLNDYGSLEGIYTSLEKIQGAVKKKLEAGKEAAEHSRYLAQLMYDAPVDIDLEDAKLQGFDIEILRPLLQKLNFQVFLDRIEQLRQVFGYTERELEETSTEAVATLAVLPSDNGDPDLSFWSAEETEAYQQQQTSQTTQIQPHIIDTKAKLTQLVKLLQKCTDQTNPVAWDTETNDLEPRNADLVGIGCCWGANPDEVAYLPLGHKKGKNLDKDLALEALRPILESAEYPKVLQNAKFDRLVLLSQGIKLSEIAFETMLASYVLNPDDSHNLSNLAEGYLQEIKPKSYTDLVPKGQTIDDLDIQAVANYCGMDAYATFMLVPQLRAKLEAFPQLHKLLLAVEQPLEPVLAEMEYQGVRIDQAYLGQLSQQLEKDLKTIEEQAYQLAGEEFNLGSPKQLSELLFEKLGLDRRKSRKIKTGYSTDHATLEKLQGDHPLIEKILEHRTLSKLKSTYVDALPALVRSDTGRVHTDFNQAVTSTGRLSSSSPNLQNIPIRTAFSRQIRQAFLPEPGWLLVAADYSQIELRILAHLSKEPVLVETYRNNEDIHTVTARLLFEKEQITPDERRLGKTINFGVIYGMGPQRFAREAGVSPSEGKVFIDRIKQRYPRVFDYLERTKLKAIAQGYVETILGRRRYFNFSSENLRRLHGSKLEEINLDELKRIGAYDAGLLRAAANSPIQGSSADIIKVAMVKLPEVLQKYRARMLLQVHDELIFEVSPEDWQELQPQIKETMESAVELSVPLVVEVKAGKNWMETK